MQRTELCESWVASKLFVELEERDGVDDHLREAKYTVTELRCSCRALIGGARRVDRVRRAQQGAVRVRVAWEASTEVWRHVRVANVLARCRHRAAGTRADLGGRRRSGEARVRLRHSRLTLEQRTFVHRRDVRDDEVTDDLLDHRLLRRELRDEVRRITRIENPAT